MDISVTSLCTYLFPLTYVILYYYLLSFGFAYISPIYPSADLTRQTVHLHHSSNLSHTMSYLSGNIRYCSCGSPSIPYRHYMEIDGLMPNLEPFQMHNIHHFPCKYNSNIQSNDIVFYYRYIPVNCCLSGRQVVLIHSL